MVVAIAVGLLDGVVIEFCGDVGNCGRVLGWSCARVLS